MEQFIRLRRADGTFFFTAQLRDPNSTLLIDRIDVLRRATRHIQQKHPFTIDAIAVLPATLHAIWTLPPGNRDMTRRWDRIRETFQLGLGPTHSGKGNLWQERLRHVEILNGHDMLIRRRFVHDSPVRAGLCRSAADWPHSSIHRDLDLAARQDEYPYAEMLAS